VIKTRYSNDRDTSPQSSNVTATTFDPKTGKLQVWYRSGGVYSYEGVDQDLYDRLRSSPSIGSFIAKNVNGKFKHKRL